MYRYYSTQRPVGPGSYPKPYGNKVLEICNFDERTYCEEIGREAWGYIDYKYLLTQKEADSYELKAGGMTAELTATKQFRTREEMIKLFEEYAYSYSFAAHSGEMNGVAMNKDYAAGKAEAYEMAAFELICNME